MDFPLAHTVHTANPQLCALLLMKGEGEEKGG